MHDVTGNRLSDVLRDNCIPEIRNSTHLRIAILYLCSSAVLLLGFQVLLIQISLLVFVHLSWRTYGIIFCLDETG